jgi:integrase
MIQAYIRLKLLIGIRRGDMLRLRMSDLTDEGIVVRPHKTINTRSTARIFEWTPALKLAVEQAKAARDAALAARSTERVQAGLTTAPMTFNRVD